MKKITFVTVAILVSVTAFAQRGIPRTDNVSVSSTVIKKTTKLSESKFRFQQLAELHMGYSFDSGGFLVGGTYSGGCRFSNWFYLGAGVGYYGYTEGTWVPIYIHTRGYFSKKTLKPYASLSLGGAYNGYQRGVNFFEDFVFHGEFSIGVEMPIYKKLKLTAGIGISQMGVPIKIGLSF